MTLIILLFCIGAQRYVHLNSYSHRWQWFAPYFKWLNAKISQVTEGHGLVGLLIVIVPIILLVSIVFAFVWHLLTPLGYYILSAFFVWYWLDARDLRRYPYEDKAAENYISQSYPQLFAVMFWYYLFTPVGLALYVSVLELKRYLEANPSDQQKALHDYTLKVQAILDWVPLRLASVSFALVGHFAAAIKVISKEVFKGLTYGYQILLDTSKVCLSAEATSDDAAALIDRALLVWLVVMALVTIGRWLG